MRVLLTGATGSVGRQLRPYLVDDYETVVLNSRSPITDLHPREHWIQGDICDPAVIDRLMSDVDGVIHMAGLVGPDYTFEQTLEPNFVATYHLFEAARRHHVQRIIYASTHHAIGFVERGTPVDHLTPLRPDSWYGVTKACGELLASHAADRYGLDVMSIRIGYVEKNGPRRTARAYVEQRPRPGRTDQDRPYRPAARLSCGLWHLALSGPDVR